MENHYEEIISPIISKLNEINKMRVNKERKLEMAKELKNELIYNMKNLEFMYYPELFQHEDIIKIVNLAFDKDEKSTILSNIINFIRNKTNTEYHHIMKSITDIVLQRNDIKNLVKLLNCSMYSIKKYFRLSDSFPSFITYLCNIEVNNENREIIEFSVSSLIKNRDLEKLESMIEYHTFLGKNAKNGEKNIMHYICNLSNYPAFVKFFDLYPDLMSKKTKYGEFPISCLRWGQIKLKEINNMIVSHYLSSDEFIEWNILQCIMSCFLTNDNIFLVVQRIINDRDKLGWMLYRLIEYISSEILEYFLKIGVDPNYIDPESNRSLICCACTSRDNDDFFYILEEAGAVIDHSVLFHYCNMDNLKLVKYIREKYNLDINQITSCCNNMPIVYYLALVHDSYNQFDATSVFVYLLNDPDVDVTSTYDRGMTLLHMIYSNETHCDDRVTIIKKLIERGVDPYAMDQNYKCFFHLSYCIADFRDTDALGIDLSFGSDNVNNLKFIITLPIFKITKCFLNNNEDDIWDLCRIIYKKHFAYRELEVNKIVNDFIEEIIHRSFREMYLSRDLLMRLTEFGIKFSEKVKNSLNM